MAVIEFNRVGGASDVILREPEPFTAYTRSVATYTRPAGTVVKPGTLFVRTLPSATFTPVDALADIDPTAANAEYGVFLADQLGQVQEPAASETEGLFIVRGPIILKQEAVHNGTAPNVPAGAFDLFDETTLDLVNITLGNKQSITVEKTLRA